METKVQTEVIVKRKYNRSIKLVPNNGENISGQPTHISAKKPRKFNEKEKQTIRCANHLIIQYIKDCRSYRFKFPMMHYLFYHLQSLHLLTQNKPFFSENCIITIVGPQFPSLLAQYSEFATPDLFYLGAEFFKNKKPVERPQILENEILENFYQKHKHHTIKDFHFNLNASSPYGILYKSYCHKNKSANSENFSKKKNIDFPFSMMTQHYEELADKNADFKIEFVDWYAHLYKKLSEKHVKKDMVK